MISLKTIVLTLIFISVLYFASSFVVSDIQQKDKTSLSANKGKAISCRPTEVFFNGACTEIGACGLKPNTFIGCTGDSMICDSLNQVWRCKLPEESVENPLPSYLGSCYITDIKSDTNGKYYCQKETSVCNGNGSLYTDNSCVCEESYYGDGTLFGQCKFKCPANTFRYQNVTCAPILPCVNGTFSKLLNACICNTGYYNKGNICKEIPNCNNGTYSIPVEQCICSALYYGGTYCNISCPTDKYYSNGNCTTTLACVNGSFDESTRRCNCSGAWTGLLCNVSRATNCTNRGNPVLDSLGNFQKCNCDTGYYGRKCEDSTLLCNNRGAPQYNNNWEFTGCLCTNATGKYCQISNAEWCRNNGIATSIIRANKEVFNKCICNAGATGDHCCLITDRFSNINPCTEKPPKCTQNGTENGGWIRQYKPLSELNNTSSLYNWDRDKEGICAKTFCPTDVLNNYDFQLLPITGSNGVLTMQCQKRCPLSVKDNYCADCNTNLPLTYSNSTNSRPKVCVCDMSTGYQPKCMETQINSQCGVELNYLDQNGNFTGFPVGHDPQLCLDGTVPINVNCGGGNCLWHCAGYVPVSSDPFAATMRTCISQPKGITKNTGWGNVWTKNEQGIALPIYPTILNDNDKCDSVNGDSLTHLVTDIDDTLGGYWKMYPNPESNLVKKTGNTYELIKRSDVKDADPNTSQYMLYDSIRSGGGVSYIQGLKNDDPSSKGLGCILNTTNNFKQDYCSGRGRFTQTSETINGKKYRLKEGTCYCNIGFSGNRCQYHSGTCSFNGSVDTESNYKNALIENNQFSCSCNTNWTGSLCQYSIYCANGNGKGRVNPNDTYTCVCNPGLTGDRCDDWLAGTWTCNKYRQGANGVVRTDVAVTMVATSEVRSTIDTELVNYAKRTTVDGKIRVDRTFTGNGGYTTSFDYYYIIINASLVFAVAQTKNNDEYDYGVITKDSSGKIKFTIMWYTSIAGTQTDTSLRYADQDPNDGSTTNAYAAFIGLSKS